MKVFFTLDTKTGLIKKHISTVLFFCFFRLKNYLLIIVGILVFTSVPVFSSFGVSKITDFFILDRYQNQIRVKASASYPVLPKTVADYKTGSFEFPAYFGFEYHLKRKFDFNPYRFWAGADVFSYLVFPDEKATVNYRHLTKEFYINSPSFGLSFAAGRTLKDYYLPFVEFRLEGLSYNPDKYNLFNAKPFDPFWRFNFVPGIGVRTKAMISFQAKVSYPFLLPTFVNSNVPEGSLATEEDNKFVSGVPLYVNLGVNVLLKQLGSEVLYEKLLTESQKEVKEDLELTRKRNAIFVFEDLTFDEDQDGIRNEFDECPATPHGAPVDFYGCLLDSDNDEVPDYYDACDNTPLGRTVNKDGCPDSDLDGIPDFKDQCNDTPLGAIIDKYGCAIKATDTLRRAATKYLFLKKYTFTFNRNSAELRAESKDLFLTALQDIKNNKNSLWILRGHTSKEGTKQEKIQMSKKLINSVLLKLYKGGIQKGKFIDLIDELDKSPIADDDSENGQLKNIRVELIKVRR